jgi:hypothetical protein
MGFVSYARGDAAVVERFLGLLRPRLLNVDVDMWSDRQILVGKDWAAEIDAAMQVSEFGLFLLSPNFLASAFVRRVELPFFLTRCDKPIVPVGLVPVDLELADLGGLERLQIFRYPACGAPAAHCFSELRRSDQERFALELVREVVLRLRDEQPA